MVCIVFICFLGSWWHVHVMVLWDCCGLICTSLRGVLIFIYYSGILVVIFVVISNLIWLVVILMCYFDYYVDSFKLLLNSNFGLNSLSKQFCL